MQIDIKYKHLKYPFKRWFTVSANIHKLHQNSCYIHMCVKRYVYGSDECSGFILMF